MGDFWATRNKAIIALDADLGDLAGLLYECFGYVDEIVKDFQVHSKNSAFARAAGFTTAKGRNFAFACFSLSLDGLAQEGGALLRLLLEAIEVLCYFQTEPNGPQQALDQKLPKPGDIARKIGGRFKDLRDDLNRHASHLSLAPEAAQHLWNSSTRQILTKQEFSSAALQENIKVILLFLFYLAAQSSNCLRQSGLIPVTAEAFQLRLKDFESRLKLEL